MSNSRNDKLICPHCLFEYKYSITYYMDTDRDEQLSSILLTYYTHFKGFLPTLMLCEKCNKFILLHRINDGYEVIKMREFYYKKEDNKIKLISLLSGEIIDSFNIKIS